MNLKPDEYITSIKLNNQLVNIGLDDNGQSYFVEYLNPENQELIQVGLGTYNTDYQYTAEELLGNPEIDCKYYEESKSKNCNCEFKNKFGYCHRCYYSDINWSMLQLLIKNGFIDRRLQVNENYLSLAKNLKDAWKNN